MISIYKASAGSGKTFKLTLKYITLLLGEKDVEGRYHLRRGGKNHHRRILAITFTNKATEEMKRRIVRELAILAKREKGWTKDSPYINDLCTLFHCSEAELQAAASRALDDLLHDFGSFNVSTIDAFFQTVLRTFAREAELTGNYELELEKGYVINAGVGQLLNDLSLMTAQESQRSPLMQMMINYMFSLANTGDGFNVFNRRSKIFKDVLDLISGMLDENYAINIKNLTAYLDDPGRMTRFVEALERREAALREAIHTASVALINELGDDFDFVSANCQRPFLRCRDKEWDKLNSTATFEKSASGQSSFFAVTKLKKAGKTHLADAMDGRLADAANAIIDYIRTRACNSLTRKNLHMLGLLGDILQRMNDFCVENNTLLLGDTNTLLQSIIGDDDVPFIYERVGVWIDHFLIDEFQDTSRLQWVNMLPLLTQSDATDNDNLIIGDVKQCIYRFRNSEPKLLQEEVEGVFDQSCSVSGDSIEDNTNWRSSADIVRFNNTLFTFMSRRMGFDDIYSNVAQRVAKKNLDRRGYVVVRKLEKDDFNEMTLKLMCDDIKRQLKAGYRGSDIAVLVRKRSEAVDVINYLVDEIARDKAAMGDLKVISDDSLNVDRSPAVRFIVSMLRLIIADNVSTRYSVSARRVASIVNHYEYLRTRNRDTGDAHLFEEAVRRTFKDEADGEQTEVFFDADLEDMRNLSLVSLVEMIVAIYITDRAKHDENMYISAFEDLVSDFCERGEGDIQGFLKWWDTTGKSAKVSSTEDDNAIRVMTIHKSKGLEFPCVHVPFATWNINDLKGVKWFTPCGLEGIDESLVPPLVPIEPTTKMLTTPYREQYERLVREIALDELNTTYVAMTRAGDELSVHYYDKTEESDVGDLIAAAITDMTPDAVEAAERELTGAPADESKRVLCVPRIDGDIVTVGAPTAGPHLKEEDPPSVLEPAEAHEITDYYARDRKDIWAKIGIDRDNSLSAAVERGKMIHRVLEGVRTPADVGISARRLAQRGIIDHDKVDAVIAEVEQMVSAPQVKQWFEGFKRVVNERPILDRDRSYRADRIVWTADGTVDVVDYKTGEERAEYRKQVQGYVNCLRAAGYTRVRGFLWYVDTGIIKPV